jgi:predicted lipoprotein with Yx(FWY)xxD motif
MRRQLAVILPPALLAVVIAGCGGASPAGTATTGGGYATAKPAPDPVGQTVATRHTSLGDVLVDGKGRTLYLFEKDKSPASTCYGACASVWPPLPGSATPMAGTGVAVAKLHAAKRADGRTGLDYAGHPLYTYAGDGKPGDFKGQGLDQFGAKWYVLTAKGDKVDDD